MNEFINIKYMKKCISMCIHLDFLYVETDAKKPLFIGFGYLETDA